VRRGSSGNSNASFEVLDAGNRRPAGPAAGGDEQVLGGHAAPVYRHGVRIEQPGGALDHGDVRLRERVGIDAREPRDLAVLVRYQRGPGKRRAFDGPAVAARVLQVFGVVRGIGEQFLRYAAADHAGAADAVVLGDRHPGAELARHAARAHTAGAGADGEEVVVETRHTRPLYSTGISSDLMISPPRTNCAVW
jgi:hypothetical protein